MSAFKRIYVQNSGTAFEENVSDLTNVTSKTVQLVNAGDTQPTNGAAPGETIDTSADVGNSLDITDYDAVRVLFRDADVEAEIDQSPVIPVSELEVSDLAYAAPQQQTVDVTVPAGPVGGGTWSLKVTAEESGNQPYPRRTYEIEVDDQESASSIATKFANAINNAPTNQINDYNEPSVSASAASDVVTITATEVGDIFDVATQNFEATSITTTTNPTEGIGTPEQLERYEKDDDGTVGRYVESANLLGSLPGPATYTQSGGQYDLLTLTFDGDSEKAVNKSIARQTYIVALESAVVANASEGSGTAGTDDYIEFLDPVIVASG